MHIAASAGHEPFIHVLLAHGAKVNAQTKQKRTALEYACSKGQDRSVIALLEVCVFDCQNIMLSLYLLTCREYFVMFESEVVSLNCLFIRSRLLSLFLSELACVSIPSLHDLISIGRCFGHARCPDGCGAAGAHTHCSAAAARLQRSPQCRGQTRKLCASRCTCVCCLPELCSYWFSVCVVACLRLSFLVLEHMCDVFVSVVDDSNAVLTEPFVLHLIFHSHPGGK